MDVSEKVVVSGTSAAGDGGWAGAGAPAASSIAGVAAELVQPLQSVGAPCSSRGTICCSTTASAWWLPAPALLALLDLDWPSSPAPLLRTELRLEGTTDIRPRSLILRNCWSFSSSICSASFCRRSFTASRSSLAASTRAFPMASRFIRRASSLSILRSSRASCPSLVGSFAAFSLSSPICLCGSCSSGALSEMYFSRNGGSCNPSADPPPAAAPGPAGPPPCLPGSLPLCRRCWAANCTLRSTTSSKSVGSDTSTSESAPSCGAADDEDASAASEL
mmetsp:Transcript_30332/g.85559  ORF Transcript_30332/g.85559 Transcript_30332/m.85559 type:complete len:277 (-) Transcript_30332:376-1206(-)